MEGSEGDEDEGIKTGVDDADEDEEFGTAEEAVADAMDSAADDAELATADVESPKAAELADEPFGLFNGSGMGMVKLPSVAPALFPEPKSVPEKTSPVRSPNKSCRLSTTAFFFST